jgi:hypothetical protein
MDLDICDLNEPGHDLPAQNVRRQLNLPVASLKSIAHAVTDVQRPFAQYYQTEKPTFSMLGRVLSPRSEEQNRRRKGGLGGCWSGIVYFFALRI